MPVIIAIAAIAMMVYLSIATRTGLTLDAAMKRFEGDRNWNRYLPSGRIESLAGDGNDDDAND